MTFIEITMILTFVSTGLLTISTSKDVQEKVRKLQDLLQDSKSQWTKEEFENRTSMINSLSEEIDHICEVEVNSSADVPKYLKPTVTEYLKKYRKLSRIELENRPIVIPDIKYIYLVDYTGLENCTLQGVRPTFVMKNFETTFFGIPMGWDYHDAGISIDVVLEEQSYLLVSRGQRIDFKHLVLDGNDRLIKIDIKDTYHKAENLYEQIYEVFEEELNTN